MSDEDLLGLSTEELPKNPTQQKHKLIQQIIYWSINME